MIKTLGLILVCLTVGITYASPLPRESKVPGGIAIVNIGNMRALFFLENLSATTSICPAHLRHQYKANHCRINALLFCHRCPPAPHRHRTNPLRAFVHVRLKGGRVCCPEACRTCPPRGKISQATMTMTTSEGSRRTQHIVWRRRLGRCWNRTTMKTRGQFRALPTPALRFASRA